MNLYQYMPGRLSETEEACFALKLNGQRMKLEQLEVHVYPLRREKLMGVVWRPYEAMFIDKPPKRSGDFPAFISYDLIPCFSARAWSVLSPLLSEHAVAYPIDHPHGEYFMIHVRSRIDCLDQEMSVYSRLSGDGRISSIQHYVIHEDRIPPDVHLFRTPIMTGGDLLVDDAFKQAVEEHDLKGLWLRPLP